MKYFNRYFTLAIFAILGTACEPDLEEELIKADAGTTNLSKYISVGNSLTAGFSDGGLYAEAQATSFPKILSAQFAFAGGGTFVQPDVTGSGFGHLVLNGSTTPQPFGSPADAAATSAEVTAELNNLGIPGIRVSDVTTQGYGSAVGNPYFERITSDANPFQTYLERVAASNPTFFTCWLGNNDVLGYATSGGDGSSPITSEAVFRANYKQIVDALTQNGAKGVLATIPNVTDIPYASAANTLLPSNGVPLSGFPLDAATAGGLNQIYQLNGYNSPGFVAGINTFAIETSTGTVRQFNPEKDRLLLPILGIAGQFATGLGTGVAATFSATPIPDNMVLDSDEIALIAAATAKFNAIIRTNSSPGQVVVWDANAFFSEFVTNGFVEGPVRMTNGFISGGAFSLDGVHATPRGYALVANKILDTMTENFDVVLPRADYIDYRTIKFAE